MGSSSSSMGRRPLESRTNRTKRLLSSLICGASTSQSHSEMEEYPDKSPINSVENLAPVSDESRNSRAESSAIFGSETGVNSSTTEIAASSGSSTSGFFEDNFVEHGLRNTEASDSRKCPLESKESVSHLVNANCNCNQVYSDKNSATASTSYEEQPYLESVSANSRIGLDAAAEADNSANTTVSLICPEDIHSIPPETSVENHGNAAMDLNTSASGSLSLLSDSLWGLRFFGDDTAQVAIPSRSGFLVSDSDLDLRTGSVHHVDVVSIYSNILSSSIGEISNREARRNSRRLFWDSLSRRSFRRQSDSPIIVFTTGHTDDLGSHDRWLLDLSGDLHYDGFGRESENLGTRTHRRNERRWQLRSEALDEIHQQPLSLSMLSSPAAESVINSFPLKNYKRSYATESETSDVEQCHICLADYEEGDKIRVLPCKHEYHMSCVDKWLKEIHGVCPLCRCDVCEGVTQGTASNIEVPSQ